MEIENRKLGKDIWRPGGDLAVFFWKRKDWAVGLPLLCRDSLKPVLGTCRLEAGATGKLFALALAEGFVEEDGGSSGGV